ncbi:NAD(P)-binding protein [Hypomontagnella submonticulosa]|nr:NAD(P)-binding protein [Hypomontagnella submonticulosa]
MSSPRVWLITGTSSGFGLELAKVAASHGDRVFAGTRDPSKMSGPIPASITVVRLDPNEPLPLIQAVINDIIDTHGGIDVVVSNAAYVQAGPIEEATPEETLRQFQANVFGPVNVYRAVLPHMRARRSGILVTNGSMSSWYTMDGCNLYSASKAALRSLTLGLGDEVRAFGIRHCLVEPGAFRTALLQPGANISGVFGAPRIPDYAGLMENANNIFRAYHGCQQGDTAKGASIVYDIATSTGIAAGRDVPPFVPLGGDACDEIVKSAQKSIDAVREWEDIVRHSDAPVVK